MEDGAAFSVKSNGGGTSFVALLVDGCRVSPAAMLVEGGGASFADALVGGGGASSITAVVGRGGAFCADVLVEGVEEQDAPPETASTISAGAVIGL